jgi:hypothetical protein
MRQRYLVGPIDNKRVLLDSEIMVRKRAAKNLISGEDMEGIQAFKRKKKKVQLSYSIEHTKRQI